MLSYLRLPQLKKREGWKLLSPCFSNQGMRTWLFLGCPLLAANSAVVCCSGKYCALEGSCPLKTRTVPAGEHHKWTRDSFLTPSSFPSPPYTALRWAFCSWGPERLRFSAGPVVLWEQKLPGEEENRSNSDSTDLESRMHGCSPKRADSGAQGAECSQTLFSRADSLPTVLPRVMKTSALDSAVKTRISRRK